MAALNIPASDPLDGPPEVTFATPILGGVLGAVGAAIMAGALVSSVARWVGTPMVVATLGAGAAWLNTAVYVGGLIEPIEQTLPARGRATGRQGRDLSPLSARVEKTNFVAEPVAANVS